MLPTSSALPLFKGFLCKEGNDNTYLFNTGKRDKPDLHIYTSLVYAFPFIPPVVPLVQTEIRILICEILAPQTQKMLHRKITNCLHCCGDTVDNNESINLSHFKIFIS